MLIPQLPIIRQKPPLPSTEVQIGGVLQEWPAGPHKKTRPLKSGAAFGESITLPKGEVLPHPFHTGETAVIKDIAVIVERRHTSSR